MPIMPCETSRIQLVTEGWSLGRVRAYKELIGLVWIVDATHHETGRSYKA
jgi:hypothetical protein